MYGTRPRYDEPISLVRWQFVKSRFYFNLVKVGSTTPPPPPPQWVTENEENSLISEGFEPMISVSNEGGANPLSYEASWEEVLGLTSTSTSTLKGGVHISAHVHESKCFFLFPVNFMALKIPLTCTSVITFYN